VPWGQIAVGEQVLVKLTDGPIVASAHVEGFRQFESCTPDVLRRATLGYGLHELAPYWQQLPPRFDGMAVYLTAERWLQTPYEPSARSRGASWIVTNGGTADAWRSQGTAAVPIAGVPRRAGIPAKLRFFVLRRDDFACTYCGRAALRDGVILHVDHVIPAAHGGATTLDNLRTACSACNLGKSDEPL
jgi:hypothetical protein